MDSYKYPKNLDIVSIYAIADYNFKTMEIHNQKKTMEINMYAENFHKVPINIYGAWACFNHYFF